MKDKIKSKRRN